MVHFLYQEFTVFIDYNSDIFDMCANIYYSNINIVVLYSEQDNLLPITNKLITLEKIIKSRNETILRYCLHKSPNSLVLITKNITHDLLSKLNTFFLENAIKLCFNSNVSKKSYIEPEYTSCKCVLLQEILKQVNQDKLEKLHIPLCLLDITGNKKNILPIFKNNHNNVITCNYSQELCCEPLKTTTHLIMATFCRNKNLVKIFDMILQQTNKNIHLHLIDNNTELHLQKEIDALIEKYNDKIHISLHRYNYNYHCITRLYIIKDLYRRTYLENVIIFDDDQLYDEHWVDMYIKNFKPLSVLSWYGKIFEKDDYWNKGANYENILSYGDLEFSRKQHIKKFAYFGPGGCIIDVNLFLLNELYRFNNYSDNIFKIDDIWMSFVFSKFLSIPFHRLVYHPKECIDRNIKTKMTWANISDEKSNLFKKFIHNYDWSVNSENKPLNTVNKSFDIVYALYNNNTDFDKLKQCFVNHNICVKFVFYNDKSATILQLFQTAIECNQETILIFDDTFVFDDFFHYTFDNHINTIPNNWDVIHFTKKQSNDCKKIKDVDPNTTTAYSKNTMEIILAFYLNKKPILNEFKLLEKTNICNQYIFDNLAKSKPSYDLTVYLFNNTNNNLFGNYNYKSINDIRMCNSEYFCIINNSEYSLFDNNFIEKNMKELISSNNHYHYPNYCICDSNIDNANYELWKKYMIYTKEKKQSTQVGFFGKQYLLLVIDTTKFTEKTEELKLYY